MRSALRYTFKGSLQPLSETTTSLTTRYWKAITFTRVRQNLKRRPPISKARYFLWMRMAFWLLTRINHTYLKQLNWSSDPSVHRYFKGLKRMRQACLSDLTRWMVGTEHSHKPSNNYNRCTDKVFLWIPAFSKVRRVEYAVMMISTVIILILALV